MFNVKDFPNRITIELTNRCNLECTFCPRHLVNVNLGNMEWGMFKKIIDEAALYLPVTIVLFFRGESLVHPDLCKMIKYAKNKGIGPVQLASNGFLLDDRISDGLIEAGLDFISFSLDTIDDEVYKKTRINSDLNIAMENVIHFAKKCESLKANGIKVPEIQVSSVDVEDYKASQQNFIDFWRQYADRVRIYIEHSTDGHLGSIKSFHNDNQRRRSCGKVYSDMVVYWNGEVALCNHDWDNKMNIGNVKDQTIADIWISENYKKIRNMHEMAEFDDNVVCKFCDHWRMYYSSEGFVGKVFEKVLREEGDVVL